MYGLGGYYGYYPGFYFDPTYILILIGAIISMWASARVKSTYAKYDREHNLRGITGEQVAQMILHQAGIMKIFLFPPRKSKITVPMHFRMSAMNMELLSAKILSLRTMA